jgi:hypothetical protein
MASTRNSNTITNYRLEKKKQNHAFLYTVNTPDIIKPAYAGHGIMHGKMVQDTLSTNAVDIESYLFGIRSTDLEQSSEQLQQQFTPQLICVGTQEFISKPSPVIMPKPLRVGFNERPLIQ